MITWWPGRSADFSTCIVIKTFYIQNWQLKIYYSLKYKQVLSTHYSSECSIFVLNIVTYPNLQVPTLRGVARQHSSILDKQTSAVFHQIPCISNLNEGNRSLSVKKSFISTILYWSRNGQPKILKYSHKTCYLNRSDQLFTHW